MSSSDIIITVENLSKRYRLGVIGATSLRESVERGLHRLRGRDWREHMGKVGSYSPHRTQRTHREENEARRTKHEAHNADTTELWALKDVSFEVKRGEVLGVIGRNGAGKSTLLKILTRITEPTSGRAIMRGRVASLLEVGTGFHPELTGRENVYLNGAILGMKRAEISSKFDEIVAFAEVEKFIDTPVKRYSSGMYVRLAFAVAAHLEPEILLVDEVLAVGDAAFQQRCLGKMGEVARAGRTVLFVSHNMAAVNGLCSSSLWIHDGALIEIGETRLVIDRYLAAITNAVSKLRIDERRDRQGDGQIRIAGMSYGTVSNPGCEHWITGEDCVVDIEYNNNTQHNLRQVELAIGVRKVDQTRMLYLGTKVIGKDIAVISGRGVSRCIVPRMPLQAGRYSFNVEVKQNGIIVDKVENAAQFDVFDGDYYGTGISWLYGGFVCDFDWNHHER